MNALNANLIAAKATLVDAAINGTQAAWADALRAVKALEMAINQAQAAQRIAHVKASYGGLVANNGAN